MSPMVAIDIETTGLDPQQDAIIEIAAVRFTGHRVEEEWSTLINPNRPIPPMITSLTGISNEMIRNAPVLKAVIQDLADFVGPAAVIGHSVRFDLGFLQRQRILLDNPVIDTYELAAVLFPTFTRYNLGSVGQQMGILLQNSHRALDDARLAHAVYLELYKKALDLPLDILAEFVRLSEPLDWELNWLFSQILSARARQPIGARKVRSLDPETIFGGAPEILPPLTPNSVLTQLDVEEVAALLQYGGPFSKYFEGYEHRPQQVEMLRGVAQAFSESFHLMVEAGTGTGKSYAYLIPAALWAMQNNARVVVSTNTITLQDQLINKDIPDLCKALNIDLHAAVLKGRSNYLCPRRLENMRQRGPENTDEMRVLAKVMIWLLEGGSGDRTQINLNGPLDREVWSRLSAEDEGCKAEVCMSRTGGACPFYRARQAAQSAHIVIVNHALLLSDVMTGSRVLPEYNYLIVDEAHHLESATTSALSYRATQNDLIRLLRELGGTSSGILGRLLGDLKNVLRPSDLAAFHQQIQRATDLIFRLEHDFNTFFRSLDQFLEEARDGQPVGSYGQQVRVTPAARTVPAWQEVEISWDTTQETLKLLLNLLAAAYKDLTDISDVVPEEMQDNLGNLASVTRRLTEAEANLTSLVSKEDPNFIYWVEVQPNGNRLALQIAPLHVGTLMEQYLWHEKASIVLTSATLTTNGEFEYLRGRLNADECADMEVGSPFDYETAALLYLVNDIPEPHELTYQRAVEQTLIRLSKATGGRLLTLFTSYAQLKRTSQAIGPALAEAGIEVFEQGEGASTNVLLDSFRESERAVLLGTRAFWEGVDIPGEALSVLVIVKLPFDVPSDPIIAARSETFEDPFSEYSLPEAILRFRQGFGRLIRTQSDRGVVVILDRRILTKRYGKMFIDSLPTCKVKVAGMADLPATTARWLNI